MRLKPIVLSIDDDVSFRKILDVVLSRFGLNARSVSTVDEFLAEARTTLPDIYLIDLQLAEASGLDLIRAIRKGEAPDAVIIVISGSRKPETIATALEAGANDYLLKPLDRILLATKLSQFVDTQEIKDQLSKPAEISMGVGRCRLQFDGEIDEVDELGVKLSSRALIPKGTVLKMRSDLFERMGGKSKEVLVTVISTWLIPETRSYGFYAEFDGVNPEFLQIVRKWLSP